MSAITEVVSDLIDAAFRTGGITDTQHVELHGKLDGAEAEGSGPIVDPPEAGNVSAGTTVVSPPFGTEAGTDG